MGRSIKALVFLLITSCQDEQQCEFNPDKLSPGVFSKTINIFNEKREKVPENFYYEIKNGVAIVEGDIVLWPQGEMETDSFVTLM